MKQKTTTISAAKLRKRLEAHSVSLQIFFGPSHVFVPSDVAMAALTYMSDKGEYELTYYVKGWRVFITDIKAN